MLTASRAARHGALARTLPVLGGHLPGKMIVTPPVSRESLGSGSPAEGYRVGMYSRFQYDIWKNELIGNTARVSFIGRPAFDHERHMTIGDIRNTLTFSFRWGRMWTMWRYFMTAQAAPLLFMTYVMWYLPFFYVTSMAAPTETRVHYETYYREFMLWWHGVAIDHHHMWHMLTHRAANKWQYEDVTIHHHDDHGHH